MDSYLLENIKAIEKRMLTACQEFNRDPKEVKLLLATKTVEPEKILLAFSSGHTLIAENRIQELKEKFSPLESLRHTNHFIGHLQTNKIKELLRYEVKCLHSLDRRDLAQKLQERLERENKTIEVLLQVNTSVEASKFGVDPKEAISFCRYVSSLPNLKIKGLMTIGLFSDDMDKVEACFKRLALIRNQISEAKIPTVEMKELSMGMSGDLELAIKHGATIIRVGTAIFGKRETPDSYYWNEEKDL
ncbi:YggS family pyridoxal phosphate-dependent enzyme [Chryseobacterium sp. A301]